MADTKKISQIKSSDNQVYNIDAKYWGGHSVENVSTINGKSLFENEDIVVVPKIEVTWDANSNMNNFKEPGFYEIYGERTVISDNLPILNTGGGHSFHANLTVLSSTLRPANNEICVTQILTISNRKGGDGNMYIRTYNENNSPAADWWTPWQKLQGVREGYIFTDTIQVNPDGGVQQIEGVTGLNNMVDNGIYSGIYTDDPTFQSPTFIDTFTLIVINNYAVAGKDQRLKRTISQLKYAVDAITNQVSVKKRTKTDGDSDWSDWTEIGGDNKVIAAALSDLDERIVNLKNIVNDKKIIQVPHNSYSKEIISNVKYIFTTPMNSIDITFLESEDVYEEYNLVFQSQSDMVLSLPENVCWANDEYPSFENGKIYELSVVKTKINNISYYKAIIVGFAPTN